VTKPLDYNIITYTYDIGLSNRVSQAVNGGTPVRYVLDQAAGLVQVLSDGSDSYLYGNDRLAGRAAEKQKDPWRDLRV
jgi:hypothetical protein